MGINEDLDGSTKSLICLSKKKKKSKSYYKILIPKTMN